VVFASKLRRRIEGEIVAAELAERRSRAISVSDYL
jgi:hypothetical protein